MARIGLLRPPRLGASLRSRRNPAPKNAGFTLLELLAVIGIVVILLVLLTAVISRLPGAGDRARCTSNLKALYVGLDSHLQDRGSWPQEPMFTIEQDNERGEWWIKQLQPYDVSESAWQCPAILRLGKIQKDGTSPKIHYSPTPFDKKPETPHKWPTQPWLIEIASVHGHGPLIIFTDGSVRDFDNVMAEAAK